MAPAKKAPVKKAAVKNAPAKAATAPKTKATKAAVKKSAAKKADVNKVVAKKATAKSATPTTKAATVAVKPKPAVKAAANPTKSPMKSLTKSPSKKANAVTKAPAKAATPDTPKKPAAKKPPFDAKWLTEMRELLIHERETYDRQARNFQAEADELASLREPGDVQFDEESGEGDTLAVERERDLALSAQARAAIEEIDHALAKLDTGNYGICEVSGDPIPRERLEAIPWAREKVEYKVGGFRR